MGTWGTGLYSDDEAADVRDAFTRAVGDGGTPEEATARVVQEFGVASTSPSQNPRFWLALADTQWRLGRLVPTVREAALQVLQDGADLREWDERERKKRVVVLKELADRLAQDPPPAKRVRAQFRNTCVWVVGELLAYRLPSGSVLALRVVAHHTDAGGTSPIVDILDWTGAGLPRLEELRGVGVRPNVRGTPCRWILGATSARERANAPVTSLGVLPNPDPASSRWNLLAKVFSRAPATGGNVVQRVPVYVSVWRHLDRQLDAEYGLR